MLNVEVATRNGQLGNCRTRNSRSNHVCLNNGLNSQNSPASFIKGSFYSGNAPAGLPANYTIVQWLPCALYQATAMPCKFNGEDPRTGDPSELVFGKTSGASLGVQAAYTLWDAGAQKRNIDNAIVQERIANISVRNAKQDANMQARSLLATYRNQQQLLELQDLLIQTAGANLALSEEQLRAGTINSFDYRTVQLEYVNAELSRLQSVYNILITDLNLRRLTGTLVE